MVESDILYEVGSFFVIRGKHGFDVYKNGATHATRCAQIGWSDNKGLLRAISEAEKRHTALQR